LAFFRNASLQGDASGCSKGGRFWEGTGTIELLGKKTGGIKLRNLDKKRRSEFLTWDPEFCVGERNNAREKASPRKKTKGETA